MPNTRKGTVFVIMNSDTPVLRCAYVAGLNRTKKAIRAGRASSVYLADNADEHVRTQITALCEETGMTVVTGFSMEALGHLCGIDVGCAVCVKLV